MMTIAVLMTCYNRKDKTLQCLDALYKNEIPQGYTFNVFLVNDGCSDGTPEAIRELYSSVNIIEGDGNLFWNRGMYTAWKEAAKEDYDFYLWLNDDTFLMQDAIKLILEASKEKPRSIIVASTCNANGEPTYGGRYKGILITPNGIMQKCDTLNGNFVLIPRIIFQAIGNLDKVYHHSIGDYDYGYRARKAGFMIYSTKEYLGYCERKLQKPKWKSKEIPLFQRIKNLYSPLSYSEPFQYFYYEMKNRGILMAVKHFITIHIHVLFPSLWKD